MAIKRRIEIRTHTHQVVKINHRDIVLKGWCATCGQEVEVKRFEKLVPRSTRKPK